MVPRPTRVSSSLFPAPTKPTESHIEPPRAPTLAAPVSKHTAMGGSVQTPERSPSLRYRSPPFQSLFPSSTSVATKPWGSARRAGRGRGGCRAAPAQKAESSSKEARFVIVVPTVPWRSQWEPYTAELSSWPGPARPRAMEFLWAPLLGLCCSLAAADRHIVFWNSSNPK